MTRRYRDEYLSTKMPEVIRVKALNSPWVCALCYQVIPRGSGAMFARPGTRYEVVCLPCWEHWEMIQAMGVTA